MNLTEFIKHNGPSLIQHPTLPDDPTEEFYQHPKGVLVVQRWPTHLSATLYCDDFINNLVTVQGYKESLPRE